MNTFLASCLFNLKLVVTISYSMNGLGTKVIYLGTSIPLNFIYLAVAAIFFYRA